MIDGYGASDGIQSILHSMLPVLEKPAFRKRALPLSVEAWHGLIAADLAPKRSELIHGAVIGKVSKSFLHTKLPPLCWNSSNNPSGRSGG